MQKWHLILVLCFWLNGMWGFDVWCVFCCHVPPDDQGFCHVKEWYAWCTASKVLAVFNLKVMWPGFNGWCLPSCAFCQNFYFVFLTPWCGFLVAKVAVSSFSMKPIILSIIHIWSLLQVNQESSQNYEKQSEHLGSRSLSSGPIWYCLINREHIEIQTVESF